jgi:hypothetical protein
MNKTSHIAGFVTSVLAIIYFIIGTVYKSSGGIVPGWYVAMLGAIWMVTTISAVVCLVTAAFGFFRSRRKSSEL